MAQSREMTSGPSLPLILNFTFPLLLGNLLQQTYSLVDAAIVGKFLGINALASVGASTSVVFLILGFCNGCCGGFGIPVAQKFGARDYVTMRRYVSVSLKLAAVMSVAVAIVTSLLCGFILRSMRTPENIFEGAYAYLLVTFIGIPCTFFYNLLSSIIRALGDSKTPFYFLVLATVLNIILDLFCILVLGWGVMGAAFATSLSCLAGAAVAMGYLLFYARDTRLHSLRPGRKKILFFFHDIGMQCKIGSSALLGELTMAILLFIGNHVFMRHLGDDGVGAFGVSCYYLPFVFMIGNAIAQSAQPIISYNFGTGSTERVRSALRVSVFAALVCGVISTAAFILFPELLVGLFLRIDNTAARIAIEGFPYYGTGFIFFILNLSIIGYYQSMEQVKPAITFAVLRGLVFLVPCFMALPAIMGVKGIWLALPLSEILTTLVIVVTFWIYSRQRAIICR